ncbi:SDR family oxidoreductase [Streptomyces longwoodensis]
MKRTWVVELAMDGVRVNCVAPGPSESETLARSWLTEEDVIRVKQDQASRIPLGRRGEPQEVTSWIVRFADPTATWLTGQVLTIDGGLELTPQTAMRLLDSAPVAMTARAAAVRCR